MKAYHTAHYWNSDTATDTNISLFCHVEKRDEPGGKNDEGEDDDDEDDDEAEEEGIRIRGKKDHT